MSKGEFDFPACIQVLLHFPYKSTTTTTTTTNNNNNNNDSTLYYQVSHFYLDGKVSVVNFETISLLGLSEPSANNQDTVFRKAAVLPSSGAEKDIFSVTGPKKGD